MGYTDRLGDVVAVEADDVVGDDAAEEIFDERLEPGIHFLQFGDQVGEKLGHVLLLARVQRLFVHRVHFAEALGMVGFAFGGGEKGEEFLQLDEDGPVLRGLRQGLAGQDATLGRPHHEQMLHATGHVTGGAQIGQPHEVAAGPRVLVRPVVPRIRTIVRLATMLLTQLVGQRHEVAEGSLDQLDHDVVTGRADGRRRRRRRRGERPAGVTRGGGGGGVGAEERGWAMMVAAAAAKTMIGLTNQRGVTAGSGSGGRGEVRRAGGEERVEEEREEGAAGGTELEGRIVLEAGGQEGNGPVQPQIVVGGRARQRERLQLRHRGHGRGRGGRVVGSRWVFDLHAGHFVALFVRGRE